MITLSPGGFLKSVEDDSSPKLAGDLDGQSTHSLVNMVNGTFSGIGSFGNVSATGDILTNTKVVGADIVGTVSGTFGVLALNSGTTFDIDLSTTETPGAFGRTKLLAKPSGASVTFPAMKLIIDTGGQGLLANESSFLVLAIGGTDVGQFGTTGSDLYFDARLNPSDIHFRNDTNVFRMTIRTGGKIGIGTQLPAELLHITKSQNEGTVLLVQNTNAGAAAYASAEIRNGATATHGLRLMAMGTGFTTNGAYVQDGALVEASSNLTGGLSIMARATGSAIRFYTDGYEAADEKMRILSGGNIGIATITPTAKLDINSDILRLRTAKTPASAGAAGNAGDICWDASFIYICVGTDSWTRAAIAAW